MKAYLRLTKPGITVFIAITVAAGYVTTAAGTIDAARLVTVIAATLLMAGGAAALNHVAEHASDALMLRTASRPIPSGAVTVRDGRIFGWTLTLAGLTLSVLALPWLATVFLAASHVSYVFVYTPMKRRTPLCTLVGAIPGSLPVLAGCAATGLPIGRAGYALAGLLFAWQIPHFLAIGWLARDDYRRAGCPMLSVVDPGGQISADVAILYASGTLAFGLMIAASAPVGGLFTAVAVAAGLGYVTAAYPMLRNRDRASARRLFFASLMVLPVMLTALMVDLIAGA